MEKPEDYAASDAEVTRRILGYLRKNRMAGDTVEGIAKWWMMRQRLTETTETIHRVLQRLNSAGLIHEHRTPNGEILYVASRRKNARPTQ